MRIIQVVRPDASEYEKKCQRVDYASLAPVHEVVLVSEEAMHAQRGDVAHVYAAGPLSSNRFGRFPLPMVASADVRPARWPWLRPRTPDVVVSPLESTVESRKARVLPEAVEEAYWTPPERLPKRDGDARVVGSFHRPALRNMVEQTVSRLHRFRDDVTWLAFDAPPTPEDLSTVDVWVDPAVADDDFDGWVAEALVSGTTVVAARTPINVQRLEQGRTGFLVPPRDANETTHAILTALFKPEVAESKHNAARQTVSKLRARQRLRVLSRIYETLIS